MEGSVRTESSFWILPGRVTWTRLHFRSESGGREGMCLGDIWERTFQAEPPGNARAAKQRTRPAGWAAGTRAAGQTRRWEGRLAAHPRGSWRPSHAQPPVHAGRGGKLGSSPTRAGNRLWRPGPDIIWPEVAFNGRALTAAWRVGSGGPGRSPELGSEALAGQRRRVVRRA